MNFPYQKEIGRSFTSTENKIVFAAGKPAANTIFIISCDGLGDHLNVQPLEVVKTEHQNSLTSSEIRDIQPGAFKNVSKLGYLNLSSNALEEIQRLEFNLTASAE
ncbi:LRR 8 domain containing protein [Asbolus verrucosus]|uniref:LRR 8 domain containing protein n=1 Tax=Asbolus verrucosus TaxID=1661398 RepID=A0A482W1C0_ASBVE|nr:LRR 8 domain containing protein [Asbolus verrucosus]